MAALRFNLLQRGFPGADATGRRSRGRAPGPLPARPLPAQAAGDSEPTARTAAGCEPGALTAPGCEPGALTAPEIARFHDQGFLLLPGRCDSDELQAIRSTLIALFERRSGYAEGNQFDMLGPDDDTQAPVQPQIVCPGLYAPQLRTTRHARRVEAVARQLLGADAQFVFDHCILKPAGSAVATPWHQDEAHGQDPHFRFRTLSFWMPLQDVDRDNGCMQYVPGSNRGPLLAHRAAGGDPRMNALECVPEPRDLATAITLPAAAGCCIVHEGRTLHGALPNRSDADRLVYVVSFRSTPVAHAQRPRFEWLERRGNPRALRHARWRRRGGFVVEGVRWLRRALHADLRTMWLSLRLRLRRLAAALRARRAERA